jgi:hypothetical protein
MANTKLATEVRKVVGESGRYVLPTKRMETLGGTPETQARAIDEVYTVAHETKGEVAKLKKDVEQMGTQLSLLLAQHEAVLQQMRLLSGAIAPKRASSKTIPIPGLTDADISNDMFALLRTTGPKGREEKVLVSKTGKEKTDALGRTLYKSVRTRDHRSMKERPASDFYPIPPGWTAPIIGDGEGDGDGEEES